MESSDLVLLINNPNILRYITNHIELTITSHGHGTQSRGLTRWFNHCSKMVKFLLIDSHQDFVGEEYWVNLFLHVLRYYCLPIWWVPLFSPMCSCTFSLPWSLRHIFLVCLLPCFPFVVGFPPMFDPLTSPFPIIMEAWQLDSLFLEVKNNLDKGGNFYLPKSWTLIGSYSWFRPCRNLEILAFNNFSMCDNIYFAHLQILMLI